MNDLKLPINRLVTTGAARVQGQVDCLLVFVWIDFLGVVAWIWKVVRCFDGWCMGK